MKSKVLTGFIYNALYQILLILLPIVTTPYISRVLGAEGVGLYSYTYSIAAMFALLGMLGVNNYGSRTIAKFQNDKYKTSEAFWNIYTIQIIASLIVLGIYIIYIFTVCPVQYRLVSIVEISAVLASLFDVNWFFFGVEKFKLTVTRNTIIKLLTVVAIFVFVKSKEDVVLYVMLTIGSLLVANLCILPFLKKEIIYVKPSWKKIKTHLPGMVILFIPVIAISIYNKMDKVMLGMMSNLQQTGFYENTEKIINIPMGFITALGTVMLPRMSNMLAIGNKRESERYIAISMEAACAMGIALTFGISAVANEFTPIFFGKGYDGVIFLLILISPTLIIKSWASVIRTQYLLPLNYDKVYAISVCCGAVVNLFLNIILIPKFEAIGAVIATIIAELTVMLYQTWFVKNALPIKKYLMSSLFYFIPGSIMMIVIRLFAAYHDVRALNLAFEIIIGAIVFVATSMPYVYIRYVRVNQKTKSSNGK